MIRVTNVLASFSLGGEINLFKVAKLDGARYNPFKFGGVIIKRKEPKYTCLIFQTGRVVLMGCKSVKACR